MKRDALRKGPPTPRRTKNHRPLRFTNPRGLSASPRRSSQTNPRTRPRSCTKRHEVGRIHEFSRTRLQIPTNFRESANVPTNPRTPTNLRMSEALHMVTPCTHRRRPEGRLVAPGSSRPELPPREERRPPRRITTPSSCTPSALARGACNSLPLINIGAKKNVKIFRFLFGNSIFCATFVVFKI